ncbi:hypothetical protein [Paralysiella testudinis]|uniref:DUF1444 family protein n=1 Tax=Paralysiella testudinis TaxID=2809020 RepID=A0A892ZGH4_9NEIS|nr:hypothetical protein [Paralysiella testudinis]QRQ80684.1 hypothetical protein JQU52_07860 [Paralysiella testudinis]
MSLLKKLFGGKNQPMSWRDFTLHYAEQCQQQLDIQPEIEWGDDLKNTTVHIVLPNGTQTASYLGNYYRLYQQQPDMLDSIMRQATGALAQMGANTADKPDTATQKQHIFPVIKNTEWLATTQAQLKNMPGAVVDDIFIIEPLVGDLLLTYVIDDAQAMRFLAAAEAQELGLGDQATLWDQASTNLQRYAANKVAAHRLSPQHSLHQLTLDNTYDASLLLFIGYLIDALQLSLPGHPVIAVPARNELLLCGANDAAAVAEMKQKVAAIGTDSGYLISSQLYQLKADTLGLFQSH